MTKYEGLFIFPPEEGPDASKADETKLEEAITHLGGRVVDRQDWGRRPLGYALRKFREGRMLLWNFEMEGRQLAEFRRALGLNEKVLKSTIVKPVTPKPPKEKAKKAKAPKAPGHEFRPRKEEEGSHARQS